jgi:hypothetical protein
MKVKILAMVVGMLCACSALAGKTSREPVWFMTEGDEPDRYADGTPVGAGESYMLVWTRNGCEFKGVTVKGEAVDAENSTVLAICNKRSTEDGKCPPILASIETEKLAEYRKNGRFSVVLLDTRRADGVPGGIETGVNASADGAAVNGGAGFNSACNVQSGTSVASKCSDAGDLPLPKVKSIEVKNGVVRLTVEGTTPLMRYDVASGDKPSGLKRAKRLDGESGRDMVIEMPATGKSGFFSVNRDDVTK